jgi:hypothetical protein
MSQYTTLDEVVRDVLISEGKTTEHDFQRYYHIGIQGLKELSFDILQEVRSVEIEVDENTHSIELPIDYINYTKIGVCKGGRVAWLALDKSLCLPDSNEYTARLDGNSSATSASSKSLSSYSDSDLLSSKGGIFGAGGGQNSNGYYRVDKENGVIYFSSNIGTIHLEYISDGTPVVLEGGVKVLSTNNYNVHSFAVEALQSYIWWKSIQRKRNVNANEKQMARNEFYNQKRLASARFQSFTKEEALNAGRKGFKLSPKK